MLKESKKNGTRDSGRDGDDKSQSKHPTVKLADLGISKQGEVERDITTNTPGLLTLRCLLLPDRTSTQQGCAGLALV